MNRNYFVVIAGIALFCLLLIFVSLWQEIDTPTTKDPMVPPSIGPYRFQIAGTGIVEPNSENIYIGTPVNRIVEHVFVKVGDKVTKGQPLFSLDNRDLAANLEVQKASYESAKAKLQKYQSFPRPEDLAISEMALNSAKEALNLAQSQNEMVLQLQDQRAISQEERNRRLFAYKQAEAKWQQAQADYEKTKLGTWKPDLEIAEFEASQAKANVDLANTEIERTTIRSPISGTILQVKIHEGELPPADNYRTPVMVIGNIDPLYVRVSINQIEIPLFNPEASATAFLQGDITTAFPLEFIRVEPFLVAKQNITNDINEKIDTRVLQILYRIKNEGHPIFVGQQMDVFIETQKEAPSENQTTNSI